ncbi:LysR family transcriptional regulator [Vibrio maerlii]|uniref:LysR family transcriptional regulator n=1 Tax=Vibrio maerlii TaxID=2231648 RepID=UPI0013DFAC1F|nr:LysR family transcriptional regulator [Vibrio maerlii]
MQIHSREILFFIEVARYQSFADAASNMNIPASTVSRRILELEGRVNHKLFYRSKYGVSLSEFGEKFLEASREVAFSLDNLRKLPDDAGKNEKVVIIEVLQSIAGLLINDFLPKFKRQHPDIVVDLRTLSLREQATTTAGNLRLQNSSFAHSVYQFIPFICSRKSFYIHPRLLDDYPSLLHPKDIDASMVPCISIRNGVIPKDSWLFQEEGKEHSITIKPSLIVDDAIKARDAVSRGVGLSWNYDVLMKELLEQGTAIELFDKCTSTPEFAFIAYERSKVLNKEEQAFISALCEHYQ